MADSVPTGFTPCLDPLLREYGPVGACVYGRVWRYSQMNHHVCEASHDKIAGELNITRRTVWRWIKLLCQDGYLEDLTPTVRNHTHKYRPTDKIDGVIEMHSTEERCDLNAQQGVIESHSHCDLNAHEEKDTLKETNTQEVADATPHTFQDWHTRIKEAKTSQKRISLLRWMCEILYPGLDPPAYGYVGKVAKKLHAGRLADLLWQHSSHPPTGDLMAYIQGVARNGNRNNGSKPKGEPVEQAIGWVDE